MRHHNRPRGYLSKFRAFCHRKGLRNPEYNFWHSGKKVYVYEMPNGVRAFTARPKKKGCWCVSYTAATEWKAKMAKEGGKPWD